MDPFPYKVSAVVLPASKPVYTFNLMDVVVIGNAVASIFTFMALEWSQTMLIDLSVIIIVIELELALLIVNRVDEPQRRFSCTRVYRTSHP